MKRIPIASETLMPGTLNKTVFDRASELQKQYPGMEIIVNGSILSGWRIDIIRKLKRK
jgi:hypothetical protein